MYGARVLKALSGALKRKIFKCQREIRFDQGDVVFRVQDVSLQNRLYRISEKVPRLSGLHMQWMSQTKCL